MTRFFSVRSEKLKNARNIYVMLLHYFKKNSDIEEVGKFCKIMIVQIVRNSFRKFRTINFRLKD
jgi:hypothetical protein